MQHLRLSPGFDCPGPSHYPQYLLSAGWDRWPRETLFYLGAPWAGGGGVCVLQMAQGEGTNKDLETGHMVQVLALIFISYTFFLLELKKSKTKKFL